VKSHGQPEQQRIAERLGEGLLVEEIAVLTTRNNRPADQISSAAAIGREYSNGIGRALIAASDSTKTA
jgi:hypothetical protein